MSVINYYIETISVKPEMASIMDAGIRALWNQLSKNDRQIILDAEEKHLGCFKPNRPEKYQF